MKKQTLFLLPSLAALLALGLIPKEGHLEEAKALEMTTYIEMKEDAFSDWDDNAGEFAGTDAKFWDEGYSFNALDTFFRGESNEGWTGSISLKPWTQFTQYIYFEWGGARDIDDMVRLEIHYGEYSTDVLNNTFSENPMLLRYFKIPDEEYANLNKESGFEMYIKFIDERTSDYAFHNFGYLHVNQVEEQVGDAMRYYINHVDLNDTREWKVNNNKTIYGHYFYNDYLREVFLKTTSNIDEDFENQEAFTKHWYLDLKYDNYKNNERHPDNTLSNRDIRDTREDDSSNMPFNNTDRGSYFAGWHDSGQGYIANDNAIYRFVSRPFILSGTGIISVKMAGRSASIHVIDTETQEDLAWANLRTYSDQGDEYPQCLTGFNTVTMVRHFINLSAYKGKTIQLALADVYEETWASSYFDELVTYYEEYPAFGIDVVGQSKGYPGVTTFAYYFDQYIASTHIDNDPNGLKYKLGSEEVDIVDESPAYAAHKFLKEYYSNLRSPANEFNFEKVSFEVKKQVADKYLALDEDAKAIVDNSLDLQYTTEFDEEWYKRPVTTNYKIGSVIGGLIDEVTTYVVSFDANGGTGEMEAVEGVKGEYVIPNCGFTAPEGKEFKGWLIDEQLYQPGDKLNVQSDVTLVASWKDIPKTYIVSFDPNGGTGTMTDVEVTEGQEYVLPNCGFTAPEGQEFAGWLINETTFQPGNKVTVNSDLTVTASWKDAEPPVAKTYIVTFNPNGGTGTMNAEEVEEGTRYVLPSCTFTAPEGQEFDCWMINENRYKVGDPVIVNSDLEAKAIWKNLPIPVPTKYTVSFNSNGGTGEMSSIEIEENQEYTLPACTFTAPQNQEFKCWIVGEEEKAVGDKITVTSNIEIKAVWKDVESGGGEEQPSSKSGGCGGNIIVTSTVLSFTALLGVLLITVRKKRD